MHAANKTEEGLKERILPSLSEARNLAEAAGEVAEEDVLSKIKGLLDDVDVSKAAKRSTIAPRYGQAVDTVEHMITAVSKPNPAFVEDAWKLVRQNMPSFVYYANYGNLDSE